jgi:hypothetical protein
MNFVHITVPEAKAYILPIGDIHWGDKAFKRYGREKLRGNLDWAVEHDAKVVLMGDIFNIAGKDSKTSTYDNNPDEISEASEFFLPYAPIIVGGIRGNHERRIVNNYGFDPMKLFAERIGIKYLGISALLRIQVGKRPDSDSYWNNYYMYIHHTTGGGGTIGNALNAVSKLEGIMPGCDIYAGGHNHQLVTGSQSRYYPTYTGPKQKKVHFVSCGSYLDYPESYAEEGMMRPGKLGSPRIRLNGERDRHDVHISI